MDSGLWIFVTGNCVVFDDECSLLKFLDKLLREKLHSVYATLCGCAAMDGCAVSKRRRIQVGRIKRTIIEFLYLQAIELHGFAMTQSEVTFIL